MKTFIAVAGVASMLMVAAPLAAEAAPRHQAEQNYRSGHGQQAHRSDRSVRQKRVERSQRDVRRYREVRREHVARRHQRRDFNHWRPGLERAHYRHFSAPVYNNGYYRVRAHDHHNRLVLLTISAITGAIIASSY